MLCRYFPQDSFGGGELLMHEIWKRAKEDYEVKLISGWKNNPKLLPEGAYIIDLRNKNRFRNYSKFYKESKKYLKKIKPNIIHASCEEFPDLKIPTIITVCHLGHLMGYIKGNLLTKIQRYLRTRKLRKATKLIAISESTKKDLIKLGLDANKIEVIYPGIDTKKFKPVKIKNKKFTISYPSRISPEKGQHIAIKAIKLLPEDVRKNIKLQLVGFVNNKNYLEILKKLSVDLPIEIITNVLDIKEYYQKSDLVIFPTLMYEGFGFTAAEALACGKPVIISDFPAIREVIGENGLIVKPNNAKELAGAIVKLYEDKKLRNKFGKEGRKHIEKNFNWENCYKRYKKIYESLGA